MFQQEIRETVYIAISCVIAAAVLFLASYILQLRTQAAEIYNDKQTNLRLNESYLRYEGYQDKIIYGSELAALIGEFWGTETIVYIDELCFINEEDSNNSLKYTGVENWDKAESIDSKGKKGVYLTPERVLYITSELERNAKEYEKMTEEGNRRVVKSRLDSSGKLESSGKYVNDIDWGIRCCYDYTELAIGREDYSNPSCIFNHGLDFSEAYYVYLVTDTKVESEFVKEGYKDTITNYTDVTGIIVRHIPKTDFSAGDFKKIENVGEMVIKDKVRAKINNYR